MEEQKRQKQESHSLTAEFIPYDLALELKELGFDEISLFCYDTVHEGNPLSHCPHLLLNSQLEGFENEPISAPLWQQAFDWFREEKDLLNHLTTHLNTWGEDGALETSYGYRIMIDKDGWKCDVWEKLSRYETYEEAEFECLVKLIEIVKKQNVK